jgi:hypothetical protein
VIERNPQFACACCAGRKTQHQPRQKEEHTASDRQIPWAWPTGQSDRFQIGSNPSAAA